MDVYEAPALLDFPEKLLVLLKPEVISRYKYFLIEGGRVSAKSHTVARLITYFSDIINKPLRIVCGREIQNTIEESTYALFVDIINKFNLDFTIGATKIDNNHTGAKIRFRGFREHGAVNLKGLEGVDIVWVDEAQQLKADTIKILIPTIRKDKAKFFFTLNRTLKDDPIYVALKGRDDCLHIHIDYFENKHCPASSIKEADECKARNIEDYNHIWLGEPRDSANNAAFRNVDYIVNKDLPVVEVKNKDGVQYTIFEPEDGVSYTMGVDLGRSTDHTDIIIMNDRYNRVDYFEHMTSENKTSWFYQKAKIKALCTKYNNALTVVDATGVGDPIVEDLYRAGVNIFHEQKEDSNKTTPGVKFTAISKDNIIEKLKVCIETRLIMIPNIPILIDQLKDYRAIMLPSGRYRYTAPEEVGPDGEKKHDDAVTALALALWGMVMEVYERYIEPKKKTRTQEFWDSVKKDVVDKNNQKKYGEHGQMDYDLVDEGRDVEE